MLFLEQSQEQTYNFKRGTEQSSQRLLSNLAILRAVEANIASRPWRAEKGQTLNHGLLVSISHSSTGWQPLQQENKQTGKLQPLASLRILTQIHKAKQAVMWPLAGLQALMGHPRPNWPCGRLAG